MTGKEITLLVLLVLFVGFLSVFFIVRDRGEAITIIGEGDRAPDFSLPAPDGRIVSLAQYRGAVVMVHFWATWCPPCVEEMPALQKLYDALKGRGFEVLAVSVDEDGPGSVTSFMQRNGLSFPVLLDPRRTVANRRYGTFKYPETYVIDREGVVRIKVIGSRDWSQPVNIDQVRALVGTT
jgi:peroxiredoxin